MALCSSEVYRGCDFEASVNLPFTRWSLNSGLYINYTIYGNQDCSVALCSNDPTAEDPTSCKFKLPKVNSQELILVSKSGFTASLTVTFNMRIHCKHTDRVVPPPNNHGLTACPNSLRGSKRIVRIDFPDWTLTSPYNEDSRKYTLIVCPDTSTFTEVTYTAQVTDNFSSLATYFCDTPDCTVNNSPNGWRDDSGTAINNIQISNLKTQQLWFNVLGWGKYQHNNTYLFSINMKDTS